MQLAAQLSVSQSLVAHLNGAMKNAIEKADDGDALQGELLRQLDETQKELGSISDEKVRRAAVGCGRGMGALTDGRTDAPLFFCLKPSPLSPSPTTLPPPTTALITTLTTITHPPTHPPAQAELTRILISAKAEMAESKGQLQKTIKEIRRVMATDASAVSKLVDMEALLAARMAWEGDDAPARGAVRLMSAVFQRRGSGAGGSSAHSFSSPGGGVEGVRSRASGIFAGLRRGSAAGAGGDSHQSSSSSSSTQPGLGPMGGGTGAR